MEWGFSINPYDSCAANKIMNGKQLTVTWNMDYLKTSHVQVCAMDDLINQMNEKLGKEGPQNISHGKVHD